MRVAVLDDYQAVASESADWSVVNAEVEFFHDHLSTGPGLVERLLPFEVICAMRERTPFPRALLEQLPNLRLLVTTGRRNAAIDVAAAEGLGVTVSGTSSPGHATAELAMALILALARKLPEQWLSMSSGGWQAGLGRDLRGAVLGVVGLGRLGAQVAGLGQAFGMEVCAWSENLAEVRTAEVGVRHIDRRTLFGQSDFVTIHLRLSERTRGLVGEAEFDQMKSDAFLINTSRAPIVDTAALVAALNIGKIGGAALDVFDDEPLAVDDPLRSTPGLLLTPHVGYVTRETYEIFYRETVDVVAAWLAGRPINVIASP